MLFPQNPVFPRICILESPGDPMPDFCPKYRKFLSAVLYYIVLDGTPNKEEGLGVQFSWSGLCLGAYRLTPPSHP